MSRHDDSRPLKRRAPDVDAAMQVRRMGGSAPPSSSRSIAPAVFDAAGSLAELYRATDWSKSSIGPPRSWSTALWAGLGTIFSTCHPAVIFWGESGAFLYNQAFSDRTPSPPRLGGAIETVTGGMQNVLASQVRRVMGGGAATWLENQIFPTPSGNGPHDASWNCSLDPIGDATTPGGIGGVLVLCSSTTKLVLAEKRAVAAAERLGALLEQSPSFLALLDGPDHRIAFANGPYRRMAGGRDAVGQRVAAIFPEAAEQGFIGLLDEVFRTGEPCTVKGARHRMRPTAGGEPLDLVLDYICQPIRDADGVITGVYVQGNDVTELTQALHRQSILARLDDLTGLANRAATLEAIGRAIAAQRRNPAAFSLLYIDLDDFKQLNDRLGHAAGDQALCQVAAALTAVIRADDIAGRVGGDEFAVVIGGDRAAADAIARRITAEIARRTAPGGRRVGASIGIASFVDPPLSAEAALAEADAAMYDVKRRTHAP